MKYIIENENLKWYINNIPDFLKEFYSLGIEDSTENKIDFMIYHRQQEKYNSIKYRCGDVI